MRKIHPASLLVLLSTAALLGAWFSLTTGPLSVSLHDILRQPDSLQAQVFWELRFPRSATAFMTGALLGIAGALMQVLLRNPLADPYILGISGGASTGALLAIMAGAGTLVLQTSAFAGALLSILLVFSLAHGRGNWDTTRLLLTGVVLAAGWGAIISLLLAISPGTRVQGMLFWLMGDLGFAQSPVPGGIVLLAVTLLAFMLSAALNLLAGGELRAASLGVDTGRLRVAIYLLASLATATAVTQAGNIGFIGLIAPHMLRLAGARDHRVLIPGVVLLGGTLLLFADGLSRLVIAPRQLPVGVLTALLGVPLFLYLLYRSRGIRHG
ncbi:MAG TPA: iron ABC transporter permease [Gammaproteobacteria bacterium]|nr:iron ABC transporter permease [Gammaproteobacteria bacterium]